MAKKQPAPAQRKSISPKNTPTSTAYTNLGMRDLVLPEFFGNVPLQTFLLAAFAFLLYANSLWHNFTQDDAIVITDNMFTKQGFGGIGGILSKDTFFGFFKVEGKDMLVSGGRYRPFTLVIFAMIYQFVGQNSFVFHLLTVLFFAGTCALLYRTLLLMFRAEHGQGYAALVAWIATFLFAAHPVHTEVVDNIKGCDEIITLMGSIGTMWLIFKALDTNKILYALLSALVFFCACMSKENAVTFLVVIPLAMWVFRKPDLGKAIVYMLPVLGGFVLFFLIRSSILGVKLGNPPLELMNNPYIKLVGNGRAPFTFAEKFATIIYTLGKYILLMIAPVTLTHDYYPRMIEMMTFGKPAVLLSLLTYIALAIGGILLVSRRSAIGFGIVYYLVTLGIVSNLVFPVGTNMAERFLFMPSVGFCLIVGVLLANLLRSGDKWDIGRLVTPLVIAGAIGALYSVKTFVRNFAWETNEKLFFTDVETSGNSAKIRNACGGILFDKARVEKDETLRNQYCRESIGHLNKAIEIYKDYSDAYMSRGGAHLVLNEIDKSIADYRKVVQLKPQDKASTNALSVALREGGKYYGEKKGDLATAQKLLTESWSLNNTDAATARLLGVANGMSQNHQGAITWFQRAVDIEPTSAGLWFDLGTAYMMSGNKAKGDELHAKALQLDPQYLQNKQKGQ